MTNEAYFIIAYICLLCNEYIQEFFKNRRPTVDVQSNIDLYNSINLILNNIASYYGFDRIGVNLFHNGTITLNRIHLLKTSRIYSSDGLFEKHFQNVELQPLYENILGMINKGYVYVDVEALEDDYLKKFINCASVIYMPIYLNREIAGFVSFENYVKRVNTTKEIQSLKKEVLNIELKMNEKK